MTKITVIMAINEAHAAGCRDLARKRYYDNYTVNANTAWDVWYDAYVDHVAGGEMTMDECFDSIRIMDCCNLPTGEMPES